MSHWKVITSKDVSLTIIFGKKFIATGSVEFDIRNKHLHVNLKEDTLEMMAKEDECEFSVQGIIRGLEIFDVKHFGERFDECLDKVTEISVEQMTLTFGE